MTRGRSACAPSAKTAVSRSASAGRPAATSARPPAKLTPNKPDSLLRREIASRGHPQHNVFDHVRRIRRKPIRPQVRQRGAEHVGARGGDAARQGRESRLVNAAAVDTGHDDECRCGAGGGAVQARRDRAVPRGRLKILGRRRRSCRPGSTGAGRSLRPSCPSAAPRCGASDASPTTPPPRRRDESGDPDRAHGGNNSGS